MYKVIFSDLDGTLLTDEKKISKIDIEAINKAKEMGVKFLFCTGRLPFCYEMFNEIDLSNAISTNGQIIYSDGKIIRNKALEKLEAKKIIDYAIKHEEYLRIFTNGYLYCLNPEKGGNDVNFYIQAKGVDAKEAIEVVNEKPIAKVAFHTTHKRLLEIRKDIEDMNLNVDQVFSNPEFLEVIVKGESKGKGIEYYCKYNNIDIKDTIGVGDEENDMPMLKTVGLSCCPSNATKEVKNICNYVTNANNNEGSIAEIINKYILNKEDI